MIADQRAWRALPAVVAIAGLALVLGYFALGMPGMDHSGGSMAGMDHDGSAVVELVGVDRFTELATDPAAVVLNVRSPLGPEEIPGTHAALNYVNVLGWEEFPDDVATPVLLYCNNGRFATYAAQTLQRRGYTSVTILEGGLSAWKGAGRPTVIRPPVEDDETEG